jgi:hypothetical protein
MNSLIVLMVLTAPVPVHKELPPGFYPGEYRMQWGPCADVAKFHKDGRYEYIFASRSFEGRYVWHEKDKVIELWEREVNKDNYEYYLFYMDKDFKKGVTDRRTELKFELLKRYR